jgi:hypothetical protein
VSVPVALNELPEQIERFGCTPYLVTVAADGRPRATSVTVRLHRDLLMAGAGRQTAANVAANDAVALLRPAPEPGAHALILDGRAVHGGPQTDLVVFIQPSKAVLHVTSAAS